MPRNESLSQTEQLKTFEEQLRFLTRMLGRKGIKQRFTGLLEQEYILSRNARFLEADIRIAIGGLIFFMLFSWSDIILGGDLGIALVIWRLIIAGVLLGFIIAIPLTSYKTKVIPLVALGVWIAGLSVIVFAAFIPSEFRFAYHLGMIPIQVFAMAVLRYNLRHMVTVSLSLLLCYFIMLITTPQLTGLDYMDKLIKIFMPIFICFWLILMGMGFYLANAMERSDRESFIQNKLLTIEAERLTILTQQLHRLSTTDSLTGVANRRSFEDNFEKEWRRAIRHQLPLSLIMIDVDYFKRYNDTYGHQQGDECLKAISQVMASHCQRPSDFCARFGGEEFIVLLAQSDKSEARLLAQSICDAVEALQIPHSGSHHQVCTISVGVASVLPTEDGKQDDLLRHADQAMYMAKANGRNRVEVFNEPF